MIEKLLENWLDSASERSYQAVFVQMLAASGYTVLHSTRHCLLEYGKDILAIAPDGVGCAFQLKGAPKGRMKIAEFRADIQPQLVQLMSQAPSYPGFPKGVHRAYLVSNGQYEEEVQLAVREMNMLPFPAKLELWSRGHLFELCKKHGASLWPSELADNRSLLELYMENPRGQFPIATLGAMLESVLCLAIDAKPLKSTELARAATSAAWLTGISISNFAEVENHQACALAWTLCSVMLIGASERHMNGDQSTIQTSLQLTKNAALDALASLWDEVKAREHLVEGNPLSDPEIYRWRITVLYALLTCLAVADSFNPIISIDSRAALTTWLKGTEHKLDIWGEGAIASVFPWLVWLRKNEPTGRPDEEVAIATTFVIERNQSESRHPLASPYYDAEASLRQRLGLTNTVSERAALAETFAGSSYMAEVLMHLLVRTNMKMRCKSLWSNFTKLGHRGLQLKESWQYCLLRATSGVDDTRIYPSTYQWAQLKQDALQQTPPNRIPRELHDSPWLLALWWQVAPQRLNSEAARVFIDNVLPGWGT